MLIRAEDGAIYNLDHAYKIDVRPSGDGHHLVTAHFNMEKAAQYAGGPVVSSGDLIKPTSKDEAETVLQRIFTATDNLDLTKPATG